MHNEFWHKEIIEVDLINIAEQIQDFEMFYESLIDTIKQAKRKPHRPGWELHYDLFGWREYKFFSVMPPR